VDDLVGVSVYDAPELTRNLRVEADGTIHLPLLKEGVQAAGLLPRQLEASVAEALKTGKILVDPFVKVTVVEYHSRPISVMGAVHKPVTFQSIGKVTLLDALARAE
jgi:polysaccharide export outer membrane protein